MATPYTPNLAGSGRDFRRGAGSEALLAAKWREPTPPEEAERRYPASRQNNGRATQLDKGTHERAVYRKLDKAKRPWGGRNASSPWEASEVKPYIITKK